MQPRPFIEPDPHYLRQVIEHRPATFWDSLGRGLSQLPRLALLLALAAVTVMMVGALGSKLSPYTKQHLDSETLAMAVWCWGSLTVLAELCILAVRSSADLAWPGGAPTTAGLFGRTLLGAVIYTFFSLLVGGPIAFVFMLLGSVMIFGWSLPAALRGVRTCRWGLRSLRATGDPASPDVLATQRGKLGRRLVVGRLEQDKLSMSIHGQGEIARYDRGFADFVIQLDVPPQPLCIVADAHVDDGGYRSGGIRLDSGGLPVWLVKAEDAKARLAGLRSRLRLAEALDALHLGTVALGGAGLCTYVVLAVLASL